MDNNGKIKLGYQIPSGEEVDIPLSHLIATGITQLSGKTTTIEALISRSGKTVIVFKTKVGEKSFANTHEAFPFFKDRSDYEFVRSLIEAYSREKLFIEKGTLMDLCKDTRSLQEIKASIDNTLANAKLRAMEKEIYTRLQHYLGNVLPQIRDARLSKSLTLALGINVMNLEKFSEEVQSLIIQSVLDEVLVNKKDIIIVVPEAWKFIPQKHNNPCKRAVESFVRQGAASGNYLWMDSQDLAGVDKIPLKQVSTYIMGYQAERNEVKHTLDQLPLSAKSKPKEDEIMTLKIGQFFIATNEGVKMCYVQPLWLGDTEAKEIAMGKRPVSQNLAVTIISKPAGETAYRPTRPPVVPCDSLNPPTPSVSLPSLLPDDGLRSRVTILETQVHSLRAEILNRIEEFEMRTRASGGSPVYVVSPIEKIQKTFQEEAKQHVLIQIGKLDDDQKKILLFVEAQGKGCPMTMIIDKCLHLSAGSGGTRDRISKKIKEMDSLQVVRRDKNSVVYPGLHEFVTSCCQVHGTTNNEIDQVCMHILAEMVK